MEIHSETGEWLLAFVTDIRRLFEKGAYFWRKAFTVKRTALAAAFRAIGLAVWASTEAFHRAGAKLFTFRTFPCHFCGIMVHDGAVPAHLP